ncbi:MAG TPA: patatin-like phospholipase family protein [Thermoanaerobaculia bacterium]|nr:patatin-like phospholipase family protein [Thermoanaerobaculia bacterium]
MPPLALSFPEVLEDEYRYLFADEPFKAVTFDRAHVREIADLANFLETAFRPGSGSTSCWQLLADHCFGKDGTRSRTESREDAVVVALNEMLREPALLENLAADDQFRRDLIESPQLQQSLLRIPKARRLLLERVELAVEMADDAIIDAFASRSPAIRLLVHAGFRPAFRTYPALLSTVADNAALSAALERDPSVRQKLIRMFTRPSVDVAIHWFAARVSRRLGGWLLKTLIDRPNDLVTMSQDAGTLLGMIDPDAEIPSETPAIPIEHLSRFNGVLLETAYRHYLSNGQTVRALYSAFHLQNTAALCLSGGGIRSATFNLGILQGLADHQMLNRIHYLSTVSGGGYIGSWLSSWMRRHGEGSIGVAKDLSRQVTDPLLPEVKPIVHLREYSSYLAPRASAFSLDGWTLVATYLRNLFLNWTMLLPFLVAALSVPRLLEMHIRQSMMVPAPHLGMVLSRHWLDVVKRLMFLPEHRLGLIAAGLAFFSTTAIGAMRPTCKPIAEKAQRPWPLWWWFAPLGFSGIAFCVYWAWPGNMFVNGRYLLMGLFAIGAMLGAIVHAGKRLWIHVMAETGSSEQSRLRKTAIFLISFFKFRQPLGYAALEIVFAGVAGAVGGMAPSWNFPANVSPGLDAIRRAHRGVCLPGAAVISLSFLHRGDAARWLHDTIFGRIRTGVVGARCRRPARIRLVSYHAGVRRRITTHSDFPGTNAGGAIRRLSRYRFLSPLSAIKNEAIGRR